jgi:hypothetical protein
LVMGNPTSKIPPALHAWVLQLAGEGKIGSEIAEALWREHRCESSARAVQRLLERHSEERKQISKAVAREEFRKFVLPSARRLDKMARLAFNIGIKAIKRAEDLRTGPGGHPHHPLANQHEIVAIRAFANARHCSNTSLYFAGLNEPDKPDAPAPGTLKDKREKLLKRIQEIVRKIDEKERAKNPDAEKPDGEKHEDAPPVN